MLTVTERLERISVAKTLVLLIALSLFLTIVVEVVAANKIKTQVRVTKEQSLGINPLPTALDYGDLPRGAGETRFVVLENQGTRPVYIVVWTVGGINNLLKVNKNYFVLKGKEETKLAFNLRVPPSGPLRTYKGMVYIFRLPYLAI